MLVSLPEQIAYRAPHQRGVLNHAGAAISSQSMGPDPSCSVPAHKINAVEVLLTRRWSGQRSGRTLAINVSAIATKATGRRPSARGFCLHQTQCLRSSGLVVNFSSATAAGRRPLDHAIRLSGEGVERSKVGSTYETSLVCALLAHRPRIRSGCFLGNEWCAAQMSIRAGAKSNAADGRADCVQSKPGLPRGAQRDVASGRRTGCSASPVCPLGSGGANSTAWLHEKAQMQIRLAARGFRPAPRYEE
jgi:hypothetical protein